MKTLTIVITLAMCAMAGAREWTSADGRKLEADFVSASGDMVVLRRASDGQIFKLPTSRLSPEDQVFIAAQGTSSGTVPAPATVTASAKPIGGPYAQFITGDWALSQFKDLPFALYGAKDLNAAQTYPLILALHGRSQNNDNGKQVGGWMKSFTKDERYQKHPCIIVAPLGYQPYGGSGTAWNEQPGTEALALVKDLIKNLPVDKTRVYCVGYSMGGFGTCYLINADPRLFAAGVAVAGCTGPDTANTFKKVPLWLFHAADDATVPVDYSRSLFALLKRDKECKFTEYPTGGHGIVGKVFEEEEMHEWLFAKGGK